MCMYVKNPLRALYKNYLLFTIHFKVRIIELFWLVNFDNIIQSERSLHILSEMIWFIDRPILLAPYFFICPIRSTVTVKTCNIYKKQHGAWPCVEKMQFIFFVPPNEELEGTLHPQKFGCTPKNEGKRVHVPADEKTCGHAA